MAMNKCMACGQMRDDSSGTCPGCIAKGMDDFAAQQASNAPSVSYTAPSSSPYHPHNRAEYITMMKAICLAWDAAEFGADLNRQAKAAGAHLDGGARIEVTALREFACGAIRNCANEMFEHDMENGYGPSEGGSKWDNVYRGHSIMEPRNADGASGESLSQMVNSIRALDKVCQVPYDAMRAANMAGRAIKEWPKLIPWAFDICNLCGRTDWQGCRCASCGLCGDPVASDHRENGMHCPRCLCDRCGTPLADKTTRRCPRCDCPVCVGRGELAAATASWEDRGMDGDKPTVCEYCEEHRAEECPSCGDKALVRIGDTETCMTCWRDA